jgi:DNA-binding NarL/FixJ family response regulator
VEDEIEAGTRTRPARLLITDDHDLIRDGLHRMLAREPDLEVVGEAANGREAVELCRRLGPDLVLMDVRMPEMDGLEATRAIKAERPEVSVLVVSTHENPDYLFEALKAGAAGYVLKDAPKSRLVDAVRRVLNGESPLNQELAAQLIQRLAKEMAARPAQPAPTTRPPTAKPPRAGGGEGGAAAATAAATAGELTPRELEVLGLLARGRTNPQVAQALTISRGTAKVHVERIIRKLGVSDRTQAVVRALQLGLIELGR